MSAACSLCHGVGRRFGLAAPPGERVMCARCDGTGREPVAKPYETWAWVEKTPDGQEGVLCAEVPFLGIDGPIPLQSRQLKLAQVLRSVAQLHADRSGRPVRLVHLVEAEEVERL